jgi:small GTP-binding protein
MNTGLKEKPPETPATGKPPLNIVIVGHVDHGKSTLIGRMLFERGEIPEARIQTVKEKCEKQNRPFEYAYFLDALEEEQDQNITIDTIRINFETNERAVCIIDAPGHREFLKNMISGAANASTAVLIVDVDEGIKEQTKGHANILAHLGIKNIVVAVNKMDLVDYSEERYLKVKKDIEDYLATLEVKPLAVLPLSAREGENVINKSEKMPWNSTPTFLEILDLVPLQEKNKSKRVRLPVQDVMNIGGERIYMGQMASGTLKSGDTVSIQPSGRQTSVTKVYWANEEAEMVSIGQAAGVVFKDKIFADRGNVITLASEKAEPSKRIVSSVFWFDKAPLKINHQLTMKVATSTTIARVLEIRNKLNSDSLDVVEKTSQSLEEGETAEILFNLEAPLFVDDHSQISETGRLILQRSAHIVGGGIVKMVSDDSLPSQTGQIKIESHKRSLAKAITWRAMATVITMAVAGAVTQNLTVALWVAAIDTGIKIFVYYAHERFWDNVEYGRKPSPDEDN